MKNTECVCSVVYCELLFSRDMSVNSVEKKDTETSVADGSITSLVSIEAVGTFELEHDLSFETESITAAITGVVWHFGYIYTVVLFVVIVDNVELIMLV